MTHYRTIVADPPWPFQWGGGKGGRRRRETKLGYPTMTVAEIAALPIADLADPDGAFLFLWATDEVYREGQAVQVARAWGFEPCGPSLIWAKPNFGMGYFPRPAHEPLLVCRRGEITFNAVPEAVATPSVQRWNQDRGRRNGGKQHSRKPDAALDLIERVAPAPWVELFARRARFRWSYWGDESLGTAELPGDGRVNRSRQLAAFPCTGPVYGDGGNRTRAPFPPTLDSGNACKTQETRQP